ncbi:MAG: hypothetical protein IJW49_05850 [Clostridia bacterium]|nr:hypothetical protein [Clostridia bacterium]
MKHVIRALVLLIILIVVRGLFAFFGQRQKVETGKVYLPKFFAGLGIFTTILFLVPTLITSFSDSSIWFPLLFLASSLLGVAFVIAFLNCRISYDEEGFVAKSFFGIKRKFTYDQVTAIRENPKETYLYLGKKRVTVDALSVGGPDFISHVKKRYRTIHNGQVLPKKLPKKDIFNGHVKKPEEFYFLFALMGALLLVFVSVMTYYTFFHLSTAENTIKQQVSFVSYSETEGDIVLKTSDDRLYKLTSTGKGFDPEEIRAVCDGKTVVTVYSLEVTPDEEEPYHSIQALAVGESYLISFEEYNRWDREESTKNFLLLSALFALIFGGWTAGTIIVGRNPKKFGKKVVRMFFKDGYINY